ncbi:hypothetical protein BJV82DRAFT_654023 [Fennellomyces sp. T-0311]|nr:hypothetical protein BJV82DRAFT_654023 [Fennellomyces sp. T-0311]
MSSESVDHKVALVLGATGAVGKQVLLDLLKNGTYEKVVTVGRRPVQLDDSVPQDKLVQKTVDFENLDASREDFKNVNDVYCCLATTRHDAGSAEAFRRIDQGYVLNSAKIIAEENKSATSALSPVHFLYCSSGGANKNSPFLYIQSKGQTEEGIAKTGFQRVSIFRPGYLEVVEPRPRTRWPEHISGYIISPINRLFNLHLAVGVDVVGRSMHKVAMQSKAVPSDAKETVTDFYGNKDIEELGASK